MYSSASWTNQEDYDLCYIWCHFSVDTIRGNDQSGDTFWGKIAANFNKRHPEKKRSLSSLKGRFGKINRQTQCFESQIYKVKQQNPSGLGGEMSLIERIADMDAKFDPSNPSHRSRLMNSLNEHLGTKSSVQSILVENEHEMHFPASESLHQERSSSRGNLSQRIARAGFSAPTINTAQINSANIASRADNQSSYLTISPGLTPSAFLDSPVLLSNSLAQLSPTTGKISLPRYGGSSQPISTLDSTIVEKCKEECLEESMHGGFSFQPPSNTTPSYYSSLETKISSPTENIEENIQNDFDEPSCIKDPVNDISENSSPLEAEINGEEDGFNWRKYGQKQVKGSEYPRSYYKCTHPTCPVKKKVERTHEGHITEIIYKLKHNHEVPVKKCRSGIPHFQRYYNRIDTSTLCGESSLVEFGDHSNSTQNQEALNISSSASIDELEGGETHASIGNEGDGEGDDNESSRRNLDARAVEMNIGSRGAREPRVVVQTTSEVDILDDGYRWRKYGQKVVKGNPNPRSYYKCTSAGCTVRKHIERASNDLTSVITTYEGKHNHEVPAARNSINHSAAYNSQTLNRRHPDLLQDPLLNFNSPPFLNNFNLPGLNYEIGSLGLNSIGLGGMGQMGQFNFPVLDSNNYSANIGADGVMLPNEETCTEEAYEQLMSRHHPPPPGPRI